jgi:putative tryptophan/tyrosine transport system substrate-binding protein
MRRREFLTLLGGTATWPVAARAQQAGLPIVGYLSSESPELAEIRLSGFREGLKDTGYIEGQNVVIEYRWAEGQADRLPALAADLVHRQVAVIFAFGPAAPVVKAATRTIPVVFQIGSDPVAIGLVAALNRPGGNLTGVTTFGLQLLPKRLELLHELVPAVTTVAVLLNPANTAAEDQPRSIEAAARSLRLQVHILRASAEREIEEAFVALKGLHADALLIANDGLFSDQSRRLGMLVSQHAVPAIFQTREFAAAGGLMSYGGELREQYRQTGIYVGRILKGEQAAALPVVQPTKVELIINLRTAKTLGVTVPLALLTRADEVIE